VDRFPHVAHIAMGPYINVNVAGILTERAQMSPGREKIALVVITEDNGENQKSTGYLSVMGISRMSKRKLVEAQRFVARRYVSKKKNLSEQSTNEGKPSNETSLDSETHSTTAVTAIVSAASGLGGGG